MHFVIIYIDMEAETLEHSLKDMARSLQEYQVFTETMIEMYRGRMKELVMSEDTPDYMRDMYIESPNYLEADSLLRMLKTYHWLSLTDKQKKDKLDDQLEQYFDVYSDDDDYSDDYSDERSDYTDETRSSADYDLNDSDGSVVDNKDESRVSR